MYSEDDLLPISALQHLLFCERQCALIQVEQVWAENRFTAEGRVLHENVHEAGVDHRNNLRRVRSLYLRSLALGICGVADVVEFIAPEGLRAADLPPNLVASLPPSQFQGWQVHPVEFKRGRLKSDPYDEVQLCAQALCLEEMLHISISTGYIFYGAEQKRRDVSLDEPLRQLVKQSCERVRLVITQQVFPRAEYKKQCESCSLIEVCLPSATERAESASQYFLRTIESTISEEGPRSD